MRLVSIAASIAVGLLSIAHLTSAQTLAEFKADYETLVKQVNDRSGELAEIDSFTYQKDVATFTFGPGHIILQRPVRGRPTVAAFVGRGHVTIDIPISAERRALASLGRDSIIDDDFMVCFMRIADDFDLEIKKRFTFTEGRMAIADYEKIRDAQGEYYFKPTLYHLHDNLSELLISAYDRKADGFFWACFEHTVFCFDPNRPEEVMVAHAKDPKTSLSNAAPRFQRRERNRYGLQDLSQIDYPLEMAELSATLEMGGSDGWRVDRAEISTHMTIMRDSLKFVSFFLDKEFEPDSIICNGVRVDGFRRKEFYHFVILLPEYAHRGDSVSLSLWFTRVGNDYYVLLPSVENSKPVLRSLNLIYPKGYNYALPEAGPVSMCQDGRMQCSATKFLGQGISFTPFPTGFDTAFVDIDGRLRLNFIASDYGDMISEKDYQEGVTEAFRYFLNEFGSPSGFREMYVVPTITMAGAANRPGIVHIPAKEAESFLGGFALVAGDLAATQWFGPTVRLASYRENWMKRAIPTYLGVMYVAYIDGPTAMYSNLKQWQAQLEYTIDHKEDAPLAIGSRADDLACTAKGVWLLHMLRVLMRDVKLMDDQVFTGFLKDVVKQANERTFSNEDFCALAEQHFGADLDWFFEPWLYGRNFPKFTASYAVDSDSAGYFINMKVTTAGVPANFTYPIMMRVKFAKGAALIRKAISGQQEGYQIGPFAEKPVGLVFNEYESVLCHKKVKE